MGFYATKGSAGVSKKGSKKSTKQSKRKRGGSYGSDSSWSSESSEGSESESLADSEASSVAPAEESGSEVDSDHEKTAKKPNNSKKRRTAKNIELRESSSEDDDDAATPEGVKAICNKLRKQFKPNSRWSLIDTEISKTFGFYHNKFYTYKRKALVRTVLKDAIEECVKELKAPKKVTSHLNSCYSQVMTVLKTLPVPGRERKNKVYLPPYHAVPGLLKELEHSMSVSEGQEKSLQTKLDANKKRQAQIHKRLAMIKREIESIKQEEYLASKSGPGLLPAIPVSQPSEKHYLLPKRIKRTTVEPSALSVEKKGFQHNKYESLELLQAYLE